MLNALSVFNWRRGLLGGSVSAVITRPVAIGAVPEVADREDGSGDKQTL
jgi:hypothetical protein